MRIQRTSKSIIIGVIVLSALTIGCAVLALHFRNVQEGAYETRIEAVRMAGQLADASDRLTAAVRGYAATGDRLYYDDFLRELNVDRAREHAVDRLRELGLAPHEMALLVRAKRNSDQLVTLENRAFDLASKGDTPAAIALVYGQEYRSAKSSIMQPIADCRDALEDRLSSEADGLAGRARILGLIGTFSLILNVGAMMLSLLLFYQKLVVNPLVGLHENLQDLLAGNQDVSISHQQDPTEIGALARSLETYRRAADEVGTQRWLKSHVAEIAGVLQRAESFEEFARLLLSKLMPILGGGYGAFFVLEEESGRFRLAKGYGDPRQSEPVPTFGPGEGVVGQCVIEKHAILLEDVPNDYLKIVSGVGESAPIVVVVVPVLSRDRVLGVLEVASFRALSGLQRNLLDEITSSAGLNLEILRRNLKTLELLDKTRRQADELQSQQESLRASEEQFRTLLEATPDALVLSDQEGLIRLINAQAENLFGYQREELVGQPIEILIPESHRKSHPEHRQRFHENPLVRPMGTALELKAVRKDGTEFPVEINLSPLPDVDGRSVLVCSSLRDITERKRGQEETERSRNFLRAVIDNSTSLIFAKDRDGKYLLANRHWTDLLGLSINQILGHTDYDLFSRENAELYRENDRRVLETLRAEHNEEIIEVNGVPKMHLSVKFPLFDTSGHAYATCGVSTDISDSKRLAAELLAAKEAAEEATRAKSDFLANMSHEIRTPMNAVIGMTHLALQTDLTSKQRDYLKKIDGSAKALLRIINDILDFSKIEAGRLEIEEVEFNLEEVLDNLAGLTTIKAEEKGLEILFQTQPGVPLHLIGDPFRLGQVLLNLVGNSLKFTQVGEIVISTKIVESRSNQAVLEFSVRDNGIGMTSEEAGKLFRPFSQADTSTTRRFGGTGLGLSICKRLVELMGGRIWAESQPGHGSVFHFTATFGLTRREDTRISSLVGDLRGMRVLVVDDSETSREILSESLRSMTFEVGLAANGEDALVEIDRAVEEGHPYDLVLMDYKMPGMDGIETSRRIKGRVDPRKVPTVVMVTAYGREEIMNQAESAGINGFLIKPVNQSVLLNTIMDVFGRGNHREFLSLVAKASAREAMGTIGGARILVAEDNEINQQVAREILESAGFVVEIAENGREAVSMVQSNSYDAVLMDVQMPEQDGLQATAELRREGRFGDLPIIAMTAHAMASDREQSLKAGMNDHVTKPIDVDELFDVLLRWIKPGHRESTLTPIPTDHVPMGSEAFPGIDHEIGLRRLAGNKKLYQKLLLDFHRDFAISGTQIGAAIQEGRQTDAGRLIHTLKGVSGTIGAMELHESTGMLESALRVGDLERVAILFPEIDRELSMVIKGLEPLVQRAATEDAETVTSGGQTSDPVDSIALEASLRELADLVLASNPDVETVLDQVRGALRGGRRQEVASIASALDLFDFRTAMKAISALADGEGISIGPGTP